MLAEQIGLSSSELSAWRSQTSDIEDWWDWFSGKALEARQPTQPGKNGEPPLLYPLQINPVRQAARLHAYALAGEVPDTAEPLVKTIFVPRKDNESAKGVAKDASDLISRIEYENHGRSQDTDAFLSIQALGGIVCKIGWEPSNPVLPTGIRYEYLDPRNFWAHWSGNNYWELDECWIKYTISAKAAESYGVKTNDMSVSYVEYWNKEKYWIKVNGEYAKDKDGTVYNRKHPFGFVPFIYIPHERSNSFWGTSIVPEVIGLTKELNSREADAGDAVHLGVNSALVARNIKNGYPVLKTLPDGTSYIDTGRAISTGDPDPELYRVDSPSLPESTQKFLDSLLEFIHMGVQTPDVAYGKEEGTQRSGQTLYSRMWPLLAHVRTERTHWTEARNIRAEMTLKILQIMKSKEVTDNMLGMMKRQAWAPMVPVDRAAMILELIQRKQEYAISLEHMLELLGDVQDIPKEVALIWEETEKLLKLEKPPQPAGGGFGARAK